jgi:hypothetical protein
MPSGGIHRGSDVTGYTPPEQCTRSQGLVEIHLFREGRHGDDRMNLK